MQYREGREHQPITAYQLSTIRSVKGYALAKKTHRSTKVLRRPKS